MDITGRDSGRRRLSRITRWSVGGAVVLTGVFSALVAHSRPGHAKSASSSATTVPAVSPAAGDNILQPPAQPPAAATGNGVATSGAS